MCTKVHCAVKITEITGNHGNHDFCQMPWFFQNAVLCSFFCQNPVFLRFYKNILCLISLSWSLLVYCVNLTQKYLPLPLLPKSVSFVTYWLNIWPWHHCRNMYFTYIFLELVNAPQRQNFTWWSSMSDVDFYRLYNGLWACIRLDAFLRKGLQYESRGILG